MKEFETWHKHDENITERDHANAQMKLVKEEQGSEIETLVTREPDKEFKHTDANGDGKVTMEEAKKQGVPADDLMPYDKNGNKVIEEDEWNAWHAEDVKMEATDSPQAILAQTIDQAKVNAAHEQDQKLDLKRVDKNGDGVVSNEEFTNPEVGFDKEEFVQYDVNKDGNLEKKEWEAWWDKHAKDEPEGAEGEDQSKADEESQEEDEV